MRKPYAAAVQGSHNTWPCNTLPWHMLFLTTYLRTCTKLSCWNAVEGDNGWFDRTLRTEVHRLNTFRSRPISWSTSCRVLIIYCHYVINSSLLSRQSHSVFIISSSFKQWLVNPFLKNIPVPPTTFIPAKIFLTSVNHWPLILNYFSEPSTYLKLLMIKMYSLS